MFPERGRLLSGQQSSPSSRLLYDGLPCFLGSARFVYAPTLIIEKRDFLALSSKTKKRQSIRKMEIVIQDLDGSLSLSLSTEIPIYMERDLSMNRSRLSSIRIDMSLWATTPIFSYMFWPRPFPLRRGRFGSFNLMSWGMWPMLGP